MDEFSLLILPSVEKEFKKIPNHLHSKIINKIEELTQNPKPPSYKKLKNEDAYRIRVGDYRVLYTINNDEKKIFVYSVGHRKDIYKKR